MKILHGDVDRSIVEKVAHRHSATNLRNLDCGADQPTDICEGAVVLIHKEQLWLAILGTQISTVHLRVYVAIHGEEIEPAIIGKVEEAYTPSNLWSSAMGNPRGIRFVREAHPAVIAKESGIFIAEMTNGKREPP